MSTLHQVFRSTVYSTLINAAADGDKILLIDDERDPGALKSGLRQRGVRVQLAQLAPSDARQPHLKPGGALDLVDGAQWIEWVASARRVISWGQ